MPAGERQMEDTASASAEPEASQQETADDRGDDRATAKSPAKTSPADNIQINFSRGLAPFLAAHGISIAFTS